MTTTNEVKYFSAQDYMQVAKPYRVFCISCGNPMVEWFMSGMKPTGEYFCGTCGTCIHKDGSIHQLPKNHGDYR